MFRRLFAQSGISLDRLRALVEVGAHGSIVKAADGDPARQSLYSRQLKELESFFQASLVERHGKGVRLTVQGRELARISRFFLMGLSNFQRGCLAEGQSYRIGADATFIAEFLVPLLSEWQSTPNLRFRVETVGGDDVERRLHDLTLDFGVVTRSTLSRPLKMVELGRWRVKLFVPVRMFQRVSEAEAAFRAKRLPFAWAAKELEPAKLGLAAGYEPSLACDDFAQADAALRTLKFAAFLPDFTAAARERDAFYSLSLPEIEQMELRYSLAWNPRLMRLNPHSGRRRDLLVKALSAKLAERV